MANRPGRAALPVGHRLRLEQERAVEGPGFNARRGQFGLERRIARPDGGLVAPVPIDGPGPGAREPFPQGPAGIPARENQPGAARLQRLGQGRQRMVQPPAGGPAGRPVPLARVVAHKDRDDRRAPPARRRQRRIVLQAQVPAEPQQRGRRGRQNGLARWQSWIGTPHGSRIIVSTVPSGRVSSLKSVAPANSRRSWVPWALSVAKPI